MGIDVRTGLAMAVAAAVTLLLTGWLARPGSPLHVLDHPNERSLHDTPKPRTGGVGILAGLIAAQALALASGVGMPVPIAAGALLVAAIAFVDDLRDLPASIRLAVQVAAAAVLAIGGIRLVGVTLPGDSALRLAGAIAIGVTVLFVLWMVNLYNFMDGMDGFAGGMTAFGFAGLALVGAGEAAAWFTLLAWSVSATALAFLAFNFPPARIFMGDAGSSTLGFLAAALALVGELEGWVPLWASLLIFSPFVVDATFTLLRRLSRGERVWEAHRTHGYQRLVRAGWGHRRTVLWEYGLMAACGACAILAVRGLDATGRWLMLGAWVGLYAMAIMTVGAIERRESGRGPGRAGVDA